MKYNHVDDYIQAQPEQSRRYLEALRAMILELVPEAEEGFAYGVPAYSLVKNAKMEEKIMIAGYKNHVGFYPHPTVIEHFKDELKDYKRGKGSIQFPLDCELPRELILRMISYRKERIQQVCF
jgi:uncharacterized protein YdhG (YjbR/CyaY superfamily)